MAKKQTKKVISCNCGVENIEEMKYCPNCGVKVVKEGEEAVKKVISGPVITGEPVLNGKVVTLLRAGKKVTGTIKSPGQHISDRLMFQWTDKNGKNYISPVDSEELKQLKNPVEIKK